jgi:hypothetical protein
MGWLHVNRGRADLAARALLFTLTLGFMWYALLGPETVLRRYVLLPAVPIYIWARRRLRCHEERPPYVERTLLGRQRLAAPHLPAMADDRILGDPSDVHAAGYRRAGLAPARLAALTSSRSQRGQ